MMPMSGENLGPLHRLDPVEGQADTCVVPVFVGIQGD